MLQTKTRKSIQNISVQADTKDTLLNSLWLQTYGDVKLSESKTIFVDWIKEFSLDQRQFILKIHSQKLVKTLRSFFSKYHQEKIHQDQQNIKLSQTNIMTSPPKQFNNLFNNIVFKTNWSYLDSVSFHHNLIQHPDQLFDFLNSSQKHQSQINTIIDLYYRKKSLSIEIQEISKIQDKQNLSRSFIYLLRNQIFSLMNQSIQHQKYQSQLNLKKQYILHWKNLSNRQKQYLLHLKKQDIKQFINILIHQKIQIQPKKIQKQISQLLLLDKDQFYQKIFSNQLINTSIQIQNYYKLIYLIWKQQIKKKRSKKSPKKKKQQQKRNKSLDVKSNKTNQTQNSQQKINTIQIYHLKIQQDIIMFSDKISEQANQYYYRKIQAFNRIQYIIYTYFYANITLYGSSACGLSIKNSDIDIVINQEILNQFSIVPDQQKIITALQYINQVFKLKPWITSLKLVKTASIPIIKLTVDTNILMYENYMNQVDYHRLNSCTNKGTVDVDLTIQTSNQYIAPIHYGIVSTKIMRKWLQQIQCLHKIIIILKYYLTLLNLNNTYNGGLKTYTLILMVIGFIYDRGLANVGKIQIILEKLVQFYGWEFDQTKYGIDISNLQNIFYQKTKSSSTTNSASLQIKDPISNTIITKNCYKFNQIKQMMKIISKKCFKNTQQIMQDYTNKIHHCSNAEQILEQFKKDHSINFFETVFK